MKLASPLYLIFALSILACGESEDEKSNEEADSIKVSPHLVLDSSSNSSFLSPEQFDASDPAATELSTEDLTDAINDLKIFVANADDEKNAAGDSDELTVKCFEGLFNDSAFKAGDTAIFEIKGDFAECINKEVEKEKVQFFDIITAEFHLFSEVTCEGVDFSSFSDPSIFSNILSNSSIVCDKSPTVKIKSNLHSILDMELYIFGKSLIQLEMDEARYQTDGSPCEQKLTDEKLAYSKECVIDRKETTTGDIPNIFAEEEETEEDNSPEVIVSQVILPVGLFKPKVGMYYENTSVTFTINSWAGTMTYTDAETAPTWSATKGAETHTGTLKP